VIGRRTLLTGTLLAGALAALPVAGAQAATKCTGLLANQTINGGLEVPSGAGCVLVGDTVNGTVKIDPAAALSLGDGNASGNTVNGSILGTNIQSFDSYAPTTGSTVDGTVNLNGVSGVPESGPLGALGLPAFSTDSYNYFDGLTIHGATTVKGSAASAPWTDDNPVDFGGPFTYSGNAGALYLEDGDTVGGTMSVTGNTGGGELYDLTIGGSLFCGNTPALSIGSFTVAGHNGSTGGAC
jgi:hypothetical protein